MTSRAAVLLAMVALAGCSSAPTLSGLATGAAAGAATGSPAVGYAVGLAVRAGTKEALNYVGRKRAHGEQDSIATVAASLPVGGQAPWYIHHSIPIGNEGGQVEVTRLIATPLADCRELAFSVADDPPAPSAWYTTTICRHETVWSWAAAEPAVERWGFLQ